jgi:hypothetical protein
MQSPKASTKNAKAPATPIAGTQIQKRNDTITSCDSSDQLELPLAPAKSQRVRGPARFLSRREFCTAVAVVLIMLDAKEAA